MMNLITIPSAVGGSMGAWRHKEAYANTTMNFRQMLALTKIAERGKFDLVFFADGNGVRQLDNPELFRHCRLRTDRRYSNR